MKNLFAYVILAALLVGCGGKSFTTENGTKVTYLAKGDGNPPSDSLISMFRIKYTTEEGELMMENEEPMPLKIDPNSEVDQGELFNVLKQLKSGDSVIFDLVASELFEKTFRAPIPDTIAADSKIKFEIAFTDQLTETAYFEMVQLKAEKAAQDQLIMDNEILDNYLQENGIETMKTESGLRYVINEEGTGPQADSGQVVKVNYAGRILDGPYFDSSIESIARENAIFREGRDYSPFSFTLGQGGVIKGWDEGIALLNEGSKATLYIPSSLGYGNRGAGAVIKPNSILVFDVELVEIEE